MKTQIYDTIQDFWNREDKTTNGVSKEFSEANPRWEEERENEGCWNCSRCFGCSRCSRCSRCSDCSDCSRCFDCSDCFDCSSCSDCSDCSDCFGCSDLAAQKLEKTVPIIPQIHNAVRQAVEATPESLNMRKWHTCDTTHCRAGWVVVLAGDAGKALEIATSTEFAAKQIYKASSPIKVLPIRFYDTKEKAMEDIIRCAKEESALISKQ